MKNLIYVVEDEESIRELYTATLESGGFFVCCYPSSVELFAALDITLPDLFILDIMLHGMDGFEILKKLKNNPKTSDIPCIMVSAKGEEISKVKGLNLGAADYIAKPFGILELIARINANLRKSLPKSLFFKDITVDDLTHHIAVSGNALVLTKKEYDLLKLLVLSGDAVSLREDILKTVWGYDYEGETRTLDMHIKELRRKLNLAASTTEIETIRSVGYRLV